MGAAVLWKEYQESQAKYRGKAIATVVEIIADVPDKKGLDAGIHDYYYGIFAYYAEGRLYKERYRRGGNPCPFVLNQKIEIQYDTEKPNHFKIARKTQKNYLCSAMYYTGLFFCGMGGILFLLFAMRIFAKSS